MVNHDAVLKIPEVASDLRCSKSHVYNILNGKVRGVTPLAFIGVGSRKMVRRSVLEKWKIENERVFQGGMLRASSPSDDRGRTERSFHA